MSWLPIIPLGLPQEDGQEKCFKKNWEHVSTNVARVCVPHTGM